MPRLETSPDYTVWVLRKSEDFDYDFEWWDHEPEEGKPPPIQIPIVSAWGWVKDKYDSSILLDLAPYFTCVDGTAELRIPAVDIAVLPTLDRGIFQMYVMSDVGETKVLNHGDAQIKEDV